MELRHLRYFVAVAEELNFTRAAKRLNTAQPSLSQQVRDLERDVGADLIDRTKRTIALTPAGTTFLSEVRSLLGDLNLAVGRARRSAASHSNHIRVGSVASAESSFLLLFLERAQVMHPDLSIEVISGSTQQLLELLRIGELDFAFMRAKGALGVEITSILEEKLQVLISNDHPFAKFDMVPPLALQEFPYLETALAQDQQLQSTFNAYSTENELNLVHATASSNLMVNLALLAHGSTFSISPSSFDTSNFPQLAAIPLESSPTVRLNVAWISRPQNAGLCRLFGIIRSAAARLAHQEVPLRQTTVGLVA